jgi:hypothetical protein
MLRAPVSPSVVARNAYAWGIMVGLMTVRCVAQAVCTFESARQMGGWRDRRSMIACEFGGSRPEPTHV